MLHKKLRYRSITHREDYNHAFLHLARIQTTVHQVTHLTQTTLNYGPTNNTVQKNPYLPYLILLFYFIINFLFFFWGGGGKSQRPDIVFIWPYCNSTTLAWLTRSHPTENFSKLRKPHLKKYFSLTKLIFPTVFLWRHNYLYEGLLRLNFDVLLKTEIVRTSN